MDGHFLTKTIACIGHNDIDFSVYHAGEHVHIVRNFGNVDNRSAIDIVKRSGEDYQTEMVIGHVHIIHATKLAPVIDFYRRRNKMELACYVKKSWDGERMEVNVDFYNRTHGDDSENMQWDINNTLRSIVGFVRKDYYWGEG